MQITHPIISRIEKYATTAGIKPETVVRKATGDPRGFQRLKNKLEGIREIENWLNEQEVTSGTPDGLTSGNIQPNAPAGKENHTAKAAS